MASHLAKVCSGQRSSSPTRRKPAAPWIWAQRSGAPLHLQGRRPKTLDLLAVQGGQSPLSQSLRPARPSEERERGAGGRKLTLKAREGEGKAEGKIADWVYLTQSRFSPPLVHGFGYTVVRFLWSGSAPCDDYAVKLNRPLCCSKTVQWGLWADYRQCRASIQAPRQENQFTLLVQFILKKYMIFLPRRNELLSLTHLAGTEGVPYLKIY
jgi:hypothetical protein